MKYRVYFEHREQASMDVEASSPEEANRIAQQRHDEDGDMDTDWDGCGCEIVDCEALSEAA